MDRKVASGKRGKAKPTRAELEKVGALFEVAEPREGKVVQLFDLGAVGEVESKWGNRIFSERDWSEIGDEIAKSLGPVTETVVEGAHYSLRKRKAGEDFHAVGVHVHSHDFPHLLAVERADNRQESESKPAADALRKSLELADKHGKNLALAPLIGLEAELASAEERRFLISKGVSYAIWLEDDPQFSHIQWRPQDEMDAREPLPVSCIFGVRHAESDPDEVCVIAMGDLADKRSNGRSRFREHLVRVPRREGVLQYFVVRADLPDGADERERKRRVESLAQRAAELLGDPPAPGGFARRFHHHDPVTYGAVLQAVNHARWIGS